MADPTLTEDAVLRELFSKAPAPYQSLDAQGTIRRVNDAWLEMLGYAEDAVVGRPVVDFLTPESAASLSVCRAAFRDSGRLSGQEITFRHRSGARVPTLCEGRAVRDEEGRILRTHCVFRDLSRERAVIGRLEASERRFRTLVETAQEGIWQLDADARTVYVNPAMARMLGHEARGMVGRRLDEFLEHPTAAGERIETGGALVCAEPQELTFRHRDGHPVRTVAAVAPLDEGEGEDPGAIAGVIDVTELRRLEQRLLHTQKQESLQIMAGGIAHDFNNLLQTIVGNADLVLMGGGEDERRACLQAILAAAGQAAALCRQMLAYAGKGDYVKELVGLDAVVSEIAPLLRTVPGAKARLRVDVVRGLPRVEADPAQLGQVLMNLVTNAAEALGERAGTITVTARSCRLTSDETAGHVYLDGLAPGPYVVLAVADDGCGMDDRVRQSVFDPFFTTKFAGRGLGMAVVRGVAHAHGGRVTVRSGPDEGTTVAVYLPAATAPAEAPATRDVPAAAAPVETAPGRRGRVLLADDEPAVLAVAGRMFASLGWRVTAVADGEAAVRAVAQTPHAFHLAVLDWSMPGLDGQEVLARIRALAPALPVLISSGHDARAVRERFAAFAPEGFLTKPFRLDELRRIVAEFGGTDAG